MEFILNLYRNHATKILGGITSSLSVLAGAKLISAETVVLATAVLGIATIWRGIENQINLGKKDE